ncbi:MAG: hypothetical protein GWP91_18535 [Rhodobacterales bacterium]|nr:hypothetical protein [Rhodobacterales bacterium]
MDAERLTQICERLPIFPLPNIVLLPGELLPLHVFESRYRALVAHCMAGEGVFGLATIRSSPQTENDANLAIHPVMGLGQIVQHQPFPDGRSHLLLEYVGTAVVVEEHVVETPFRQVHCRIQTLDERGTELALQRLQILVIRLGAISPGAAAEAQKMVALDANALVNSLARKLLNRPHERLDFLSAGQMIQRISLVQEKLSRFLGAPVGPTAEA